MTYTNDLKANTARLTSIEGKLDKLLALAATAQAPVPSQAPSPTALNPLDFSDMSLWNFDAKWAASEWDNGNGPIPWRNNHIAKQPSGDVLLTLDGSGAPQLQAGEPYAATTGLWEVDVTLPTFRDGVVVAPLWLWNKAKGIDEIDFEFAGRGGLDLTMHVNVKGQRVKDSVRLFAGKDMSGTRHKFGIKLEPGVVTMLMDNNVIHVWEKAKMAQFVSFQPFKAYVEMWAGNSSFDGWLGKFKPFAAGENMGMIVHGYGYR